MSILRLLAFLICAADWPKSRGTFMKRMKSEPVPEGMMPTAASLLMACPDWGWKKPLLISFSVPSPPTPMSRSKPSRSSSRAISVAWRGFSVKLNLNSRK